MPERNENAGWITPTPVYPIPLQTSWVRLLNFKINRPEEGIKHSRMSSRALVLGFAALAFVCATASAAEVARAGAEAEAEVSALCHPTCTWTCTTPVCNQVRPFQRNVGPASAIQCLTAWLLPGMKVAIDVLRHTSSSCPLPPRGRSATQCARSPAARQTVLRLRLRRARRRARSPTARCVQPTIPLTSDALKAHYQSFRCRFAARYNTARLETAPTAQRPASRP